MMERLPKVLDYWFGFKLGDAEVSADRGPLWFKKSTETDREIEREFGDLVSEAETGAFNGQIASPLDRLAVIILLDQFTRNIYRGKPNCFSSDPLALQLALDGLEKKEDLRLRPIERVFLYLPLEHSEDLALQDQSVELFSALVETVPDECKKIFSGYLDYAVRHREIVARFDRFPHRNDILGRISTEEEAEFLTHPGSSF